MNPYDVIFWFFAVVTVISGAIVALSRNIIYSAFALLFPFFGVAGIYLLLDADFIAVAQLLIYVGGILVLLLFGVMLTNKVIDVGMKTGTLQTFPASIIVAVTLLGATHYILLEERLKYAKVYEEWRPGLATLVAWTNHNIPRDDAILSIPGEDLFYFTTGRRPRVPVVMFDRTINPFDAETIAHVPVKWLIVKQRLQLNGEPMENEAEVLRLMSPRLALAARLPNYDIYRVR